MAPLRLAPLHGLNATSRNASWKILASALAIAAASGTALQVFPPRSAPHCSAEPATILYVITGLVALVGGEAGWFPRPSYDVFTLFCRKSSQRAIEEIRLL